MSKIVTFDTFIDNTFSGQAELHVLATGLALTKQVLNGVLTEEQMRQIRADIDDILGSVTVNANAKTISINFATEAAE